MQKTLLIKAILVFTLSLLVIVVIHLVGGVVEERQQRQDGVVAEISKSYAEAQRTASPFLVIPYVEEFDEKVPDDKDPLKKTSPKRINRQLVYFPTDLTVKGSATTDWKHRGLFRALVYEWQAEEAGTFNVPAALPFERTRTDSKILPGTASLVVPITDPKGLVRKPEASLDGQALAFERGSRIGSADESIRAAIPATWLGTGKPQSFALRMGLRGTQSLGFVPYGETTRVNLRSAWPSPSFGGAFLPSPQVTRVSGDGFDAAWEVSSLATSAQTNMLKCLAGATCVGLAQQESIDVNFIEPINIYSLSNRAIKYGFLFVTLIFSAFFLFELVKGLRIHPAQYLLVGLAIAIFFLLLISLSERLEFWISYLIAAGASTALIAVYLAGVLGGVARGAGFGAGLGVLYACLYGILNSEDNSLVLGSVLLFLVLAAAMLITRKLDWYSLQERSS